MKNRTVVGENDILIFAENLRLLRKTHKPYLSQKRIAELVEIFRSKYQDCTIQVAETESISSLIIRKLKGKNVPMPLYFYVNNGDYGFGEQIIFVIDETGELKIKQMTLK